MAVPITELTEDTVEILTLSVIVALTLDLILTLIVVILPTRAELLSLVNTTVKVVCASWVLYTALVHQPDLLDLTASSLLAKNPMEATKSLFQLDPPLLFVRMLETSPLVVTLDTLPALILKNSVPQVVLSSVREDVWEEVLAIQMEPVIVMLDTLVSTVVSLPPLLSNVIRRKWLLLLIPLTSLKTIMINLNIKLTN
jgi:hypothetical protein